ncbi:MAG: protein translocase subunit SecF [Desulfobacterales bacterium]
MEFVRPDININFIGKRRLAYVFSGLLILCSIVLLMVKGGPRYGIDFAGGTVIQVRFADTVSIADIQKGLAEAGIANASIQSFGDREEHEYLARTDLSEDTGEDFAEKLTQDLRSATGIKPFFRLTEDSIEEMIQGGLPETLGEKLKPLQSETDIPAEEFGKTLISLLGKEQAEQYRPLIEKYAQSDVDIRRIEMVGPQVGKDLREKALFAMFYTLLMIAIYISGRFELKWMISGVVAAALIGTVWIFSLLHISIPFLILTALLVTLVLFWFLQLRYAMGAVVSLIHDITITVGAFSLFDKEFSLPIIAALLTIIGYSLNDTIIVFDRIRENLRKFTKEPLDILINRSVNETLSRTILTSGTTLIVVLALFVLGGGIIHDFAFALLVGIGVGTYSSIYVASPILLAWQRLEKKR